MLEEGRGNHDHQHDNKAENWEWEEQKESIHRSSEPSSEQRSSPRFEYSSFNPSEFKQKRTSDGEQEYLQQQIEKLKFVCQKQDVELEEYRAQGSYIDQIKRILSEKEPSLNKLVDLALKQERLKNEKKSQKIVLILTRKDKTIEELKHKVAQYSQSSTSLQKEIEKFEEYRQKTVDELSQKLALFRLNNKGHDVQSIVEYKEEIDKLTCSLESQLEEVSNFKIVVASLEEKNHSLLLNLEQSQSISKEKDAIILRMERKLSQLEEENESQKTKINDLVEKIALLAEENSKSFSERSKNIDKEETYVSKINSISEEMRKIKEEKGEMEKELNSVKEIHLSFLESCNQTIHPGMKIGDEYDIEFVQNGILNNIEDMRNSIENYQKRHHQDQECLQQTEKEIQKIQLRLAGKSYSCKFIQTDSNGNEIMELEQRINELENAYDRVMDENKELIEYAKNLDNELIELSKQKDYFQKELEKAHNKKHMKSTSSLAYSEEENNDYLGHQNEDLYVMGRNDSAPTFCVKQKENVSENSQIENTSDIINSHRSIHGGKKGEGVKKIKLSQIAYKEGGRKEISYDEIKYKEQLILIAEQRREIEQLKKLTLDLENKIKRSDEEKESIERKMQKQIESLTQINNRLMSGGNADRDDLEHYVQKLEINEIALSGQLQEMMDEKEYLEQFNQQLNEQIMELQEINLLLRNKLSIEELNLDDENTLCVLSEKISQQKKEIRELKGRLERYDQSMMQSHLSYSLGLSKGPQQKELTQIESLIHKDNQISIQNELMLSQSESKNVRKKVIKDKKILETSDLEGSNHRKAKDDNDLIGSKIETIPSDEEVFKWQRAQLLQQEKMIEYLNNELSSLIVKNKELSWSFVEVKQDYVSKLDAVYAKFAEEREQLVKAKKECESRYNTAKLDIKLGYKEDKIKELQKRIIEIRDEWDSEIAKYKSHIKELKAQVKDYGEKFELQQSELDQWNWVIIEKQTQLDILGQTLETIQSQDSEEIVSKFLEKNAENWILSSINKKLEHEIHLWFKRLQSKQEENIELSKELESLNEKVEEEQFAYETLTKEIESLTTDFEQIESDKNKAFEDNKSLYKSNKDLEHKLMQKSEEIRILKEQSADVKKIFDDKVSELKKLFNNKLIEYGKAIYPNMVEKQNMLFGDSFAQSKVSQEKEYDLLESVLRMSHLAQSKVLARNDESTIYKIKNSGNVDDAISNHNKLVDQIVALKKENQILQMKVIFSDKKLDEQVLDTHLMLRIEQLNKHVHFYRSKHYDENLKEEVPVLDIDQHKEIETYKLRRELASKTKKILQLEKRIQKLEMHEKASKLQSYQDKIAVNEKVQQAVEEQVENLENYVKSHLTLLLSDWRDSSEIVDKLEKQLLVVKNQEQTLLGKLSWTLLSKEKLQSINSEMKAEIKNLEKQIKILQENSNSDKLFDEYVKEIETLKNRISKYDTERNNLFAQLNKQIDDSKRLEDKVYELENNLQFQQNDEDSEEESNMNDNQSNAKSSFFKINPNSTFKGSEFQKKAENEEEMIALQNKIISFNQQHLNEMKQLREDKDRQITKILQENDCLAQEYVETIKKLEEETKRLEGQNDYLHEKLCLYENMLFEIENGLSKNPITVIKEFKHETNKSNKKSKKSLSKSTLWEIPSHMNSQQPKENLKSAEFVKHPNKIVALLIQSKKTEASALLELKTVLKEKEIAEDSVAEKENYIRQLEDELEAIRTKFSEQDYTTFGNSKWTEDINVVGENTQNVSHSYERRIRELEAQLKAFRQKEQTRLNELIDCNKRRVEAIKAEARFEGYEDDIPALLDWIGWLCYEISTAEVRELMRRGNNFSVNQDHSMTVLNSNRSIGQTSRLPPNETNNPVEICQRVVIKNLSNTLSRLLLNNQDIHGRFDSEFVPNEEGDRAVWYLELLESQLDVTDRTLRALKEFTEKISIQITGSLSSAAQVKATSIELARNTK